MNVIENGPFFAWLRWRQDGSDYTREWDLEVDKRGRVRLMYRLLRHLPGNGWTPEFGFELSATGAEPVRLPEQPVRYLALPVAEPLRQHPELVAAITLADRTPLSLVNPLALRQHRGSLKASRAGATTTLRFSRGEPVLKETDNLLMQEGMWRVLTVSIQPGSPDELATAVDTPVAAKIAWQPFDAVYHTGPPLEVKNPVLQQLAEKYVTTIQVLLRDYLRYRTDDTLFARDEPLDRILHMSTSQAR